MVFMKAREESQFLALFKVTHANGTSVYEEEEEGEEEEEERN